MPRKDPEARRAYHREYTRKRYRDDPEYRAKAKGTAARYNKRARVAIAELLKEWKGQGCQTCEEASVCCMVAHHLDPLAKDFSLGDAVRRVLSLRRVREELLKCVCLCANCHAKVHAGLIEISPPEGVEECRSSTGT